MFKHYNFFVLVLLSIVPCMARSQDTIALWTFESQSGAQTVNTGSYGPLSPEAGSGMFTSIHQNGSFAVNFANPGNGTPKSINFNNWTTLGDYVQFRVSTVGKSNIQIKFEQASHSPAGPRDFKVSYSTDNISFIDLPNGAYQQVSMGGSWNAATYQSGYSYSFTLPAGLDNVANAYIRLSVTSNITIAGGNVASGGNARFDNILITGSESVVTPLEITDVTVDNAVFCNSADNAVNISFNTTATEATSYAAELSDASGNFAAPVVIGNGTASPIAATIPAGTAAGTGYLVRVKEDIAGGVTSQNNAGPLTLDESVLISTQPVDITVCEGASVTFEIQSANAQTYHWLFNGNPVVNNSGYNQYTIPAGLPQQDGNYSVALTHGACSDTSEQAVLTVTPGTIPENTIVSGSRFFGPGSQLPVISNDGTCGRLAMINANNNLLGNTAVLTEAGSPQQVGNGGDWYAGRIYTITPDNQPTENVAVTIYFSPQDWIDYNQAAPANKQIVVDETSQTLGNLYLSKFATAAELGSGSEEMIMPDAVSFQDGYWAVSFTTSSFSAFFAHGSNAPLPVVMGNISAVNLGSANRVDWNTTEEAEGDRFVIERSADGRTFTAIGNIDAKGAAGSQYSFTDVRPLNGINYYRLFIENNDGSKYYSRVISAVVVGNAIVIEAYPNPVGDKLTVVVKGAVQGKGIVTLLDVSGRSIQHAGIESNGMVKFAMDMLPQGLYVIKFNDDTTSQVIKISKQQ